MQLHVITDGKKTEEELVTILSSIHPYVDVIHIREKQRSARELMQIVQRLINEGVPPKKLFINDRVDVAHVFAVRGVQLAYHSLEVFQIRRSFPAFQVGCSVHSFEEAMKAEKDGADFVLYGHVYPTSSKPGVVPRGLGEITKLTENLSVPVIAIGGITPGKVKELGVCGISGIAVISGIMDAENCVESAKAYQSKILEEMEVLHEY